MFVHQIIAASLSSSNHLASAVEDVGDLEVQRGVRAETAGASRLVGSGKVESALLVETVLADGIEDVVELVVVGDPTVGLRDARRNVVHGVGGSKGKLAVVHEVSAIAGMDGLVFEVLTTSGLRALSGGPAALEVVPGVIGDVVGASGLVDLEEVDSAALVIDFYADVVTADRAGPVRNAVGVDFASQDAHTGGVHVVGGHASGVSATKSEGSSGDRGGRGAGEKSDESEHRWSRDWLDIISTHGDEKLFVKEWW